MLIGNRLTEEGILKDWSCRVTSNDQLLPDHLLILFETLFYTLKKNVIRLIYFLKKVAMYVRRFGQYVLSVFFCERQRGAAMGAERQSQRNAHQISQTNLSPRLTRWLCFAWSLNCRNMPGRQRSAKQLASTHHHRQTDNALTNPSNITQQREGWDTCACEIHTVVSVFQTLCWNRIIDSCRCTSYCNGITANPWALHRSYSARIVPTWHSSTNIWQM